MSNPTPTLKRQDRDHILRATLEALFGNLWYGKADPKLDGAPALQSWFDAGTRYMKQMHLPERKVTPSAGDFGARSALLKALDVLRTFAENRLQHGTKFSRNEVAEALGQTREKFLECDFRILDRNAIPSAAIPDSGEDNVVVLPGLTFDQTCWDALRIFFGHTYGEGRFLEVFCEAATELRTTILGSDLGS